MLSGLTVKILVPACPSHICDTRFANILALLCLVQLYIHCLCVGYFVHIMYYSIVRKMALYMADILEPEDKDRLHDNLLVGTSKVYSCACSLSGFTLYMDVHALMHCITQQVTMEAFLTRFQWDSAKFPLRQPLPNIVDGISKVHVRACITASVLYTI